VISAASIHVELLLLNYHCLLLLLSHYVCERKKSIFRVRPSSSFISKVYKYIVMKFTWSFGFDGYFAILTVMKFYWESNDLLMLDDDIVA